MDLKFRKEGGLRSRNAESEVTRAWRVFVAEEGRVITPPLSLAFWGCTENTLSASLTVVWPCPCGWVPANGVKDDATRRPGPSHPFRSPVPYHRGQQPSSVKSQTVTILGLVSHTASSAMVQKGLLCPCSMKTVVTLCRRWF